jgi:pSer/pThr/pTyr-binding forkhead associated (FHA) protein
MTIMAVIQFAATPHRATLFRLGTETVLVGRRHDCQICIDDPSVRRRHAQIFEYNGQYWIRALEGDDLVVNGEWVNNHPLQHLDKVCCGKVILEYFDE